MHALTVTRNFIYSALSAATKGRPRPVILTHSSEDQGHAGTPGRLSNRIKPQSLKRGKGARQ